MYVILDSFDKNLIVNPSEEWKLDHYPEELVNKRGIKSILKKLEKLIPKEELKKNKKTILRRRYDTFNNEINENVYNKIAKAFNERKTIKIGYFNMDSAEIKKRKIDVYHKTRKYIIAFCHLRKAMRKFRTSRIVSAKLTDKTYKIPNNFDKNNF